jgi:hypothetical protein
LSVVLTPIDIEALHRAMELARKEPVRARQLDDMLRDRPWQEVARFASYSLQHQALQTRPWEVAPCECRPEDIAELLRTPHPDMTGRAKAARLLQRLLELGLSRWEPDPMRAIAAAEQERSSEPEHLPDVSTRT